MKYDNNDSFVVIRKPCNPFVRSFKFLFFRRTFAFQPNTGDGSIFAFKIPVLSLMLPKSQLKALNLTSSYFRTGVIAQTRAYDFFSGQYVTTIRTTHV